MARNWTNEQKAAIEARDGSILVSAAAGSGKTAVLVERVIERLTDENNPTDADRLLIVTFTRAAASEMKQRIAAAIEDRLKATPNDSNLIKQQMLLPSAKICTIDSFCASVVRDNFQLLDISPDFKNADDGQLSIIKSQAMQLTMDTLYQEGDEDFFNLVELLFKGRDDSYLCEMIYQLYNASMSYPFPKKWLKEVKEKFSCSCGVNDSSYGKIIFDYLNDALEYCLDISCEIIDSVKFNESFAKIFLKAAESDKVQIERMIECVKLHKWNETREAIASYSPLSLGRTPKELKDDCDVERLKDAREKVKKLIREPLKKMQCCDEAEYEKDMQYLAPMVSKLCDAVVLFSENFKLIKEEKNLADFNDIAHMALSLLVTQADNEDGFEKTPLAIAISENFDEILIDEYQDTNKAQDILFTSISRNNLFRVGDVKQSIYSFRRAMPEIFISLKNSYEKYDKEKNNYPAKIILKNNFRSRNSVTGAVNFIFKQLMSESAGDINYTKEEELVFSASYSEKADDCAEFHLLDLSQLDKDEESSDEFQAKYIASVINDYIQSGFTVKDGDGERKATYKDFCVLLRSPNSSRGLTYAKEFAKADIPCFTEISADFFSAYEVSLALSLLRVIDNPKQDIALLTVMLSVLFGFTADDLARYRINDRKSDIYGCLLNQKDDAKIASFLEKISRWRKLSISMGVEDFIRTVYDETALSVVVCAMRGANVRAANLELLLNYASTYEKCGYIGLSGFIGFVDRLERENQDLAGTAGVSSDADVVKIMSIHKSKGLEFPVCILANCSGRFNRSDEKSNMIISSKEGLGIVVRKTETMAQYKTVNHEAVKIATRQAGVSEELRVLYVALTRAKEKLIMVSAMKNPERTLTKYSVNINANTSRQAPFAVSTAISYSEWIISALLRHPNAKKLRDLASLSENVVLPSDFDLKVEIVEWSKRESENASLKEENQEADMQIVDFIKERVSYKYKYEPLTYALSKRAASEVDKGAVDRDYFASSRPAFLSKDGLTAAQRGTATHSFMQFANYENACANVENEIERLFDKGFINEGEKNAIDVKAVKSFFKSSLAKRILKSDFVMREKKFTVRVPITEVYPQLQEFSDETVVIQGIADCAFVEDGKLIVVDYKTDNLANEELFKEKYSNQVKVYKKALSMCTDYEVSETYLYSFKLQKEIEVCCDE